MKRQISLAEYKAVDISILTVLMIVSQAVIRAAVAHWRADVTGYIVSPVAAVVALVMMRWDLWALVPAAVGGVACALLAGGTAEQTLIYGAGNLLSVLAYVLLRLMGKERTRKNVVLTLLYALVTQLLLQLGRAAVAAALGHDMSACWDFITTDAMSIPFTLVIVWIVRRVEGLFEDQKQYLLRLARERDEKGGEQL